MTADCEIFSKGDADKCRDDVQKALRNLTAAELFDLCAEESARFDVQMRSQLNADLCTRTGIRYVFERQVWRAKELLDPDVYVRNAFDDLKIAETDVISRLQFKLLLQTLLKGEEAVPSRRHRRRALGGVSLYFRMGVSFHAFLTQVATIPLAERFRRTCKNVSETHVTAHFSRFYRLFI